MLNRKLFLGIETSCDECSASIVESNEGPTSLEVKSLATFSQIDLHQPFGGIVPEVASRNHLETINLMLDEAFTQANVQPKDLSAICVTTQPGLIGALLVGLTAAKSLAYAFKKPLVPVHHLEGHAVSFFLDQEADSTSIEYPALFAIISGGHTNLYVAEHPPAHWGPDFLQTAIVSSSRDDAAGEAFDKTAKLLGYPYPGGVYIDQNSDGGDPNAFPLPRALNKGDTLDFSFSGLKTATAQLVQKLEQADQLDERIADVCASIQEAIVDAILSKVLLAIKKYRCKSLVIVGGVAANRRLRARLASECPVKVYTPKPKYCTDNAAMIAAAGAFRFSQGYFFEGEDFLRLNANPQPVKKYLARL